MTVGLALLFALTVVCDYSLYLMLRVRHAAHRIVFPQIVAPDVLAVESAGSYPDWRGLS